MGEKIKRDLSLRKFDNSDTERCSFGSMRSGCPFTELQGLCGPRPWGCSLYMVPLGWDDGYKRCDSCLKNDLPPIKKTFTIHYTTQHIKNIVATSEKEALVYFDEHRATVNEVIEGDIIDYNVKW